MSADFPLEIVQAKGQQLAYSKYYLKKKKVNLGFYSQGKLLSKMKANRS